MSIDLPLLQGALDRATPTLNKWRDALRAHLSYPLLSARGVIKLDVHVSSTGTRVEPGFAPSSWQVHHVRAASPVSVVETANDKNGITLAASGDCVVDVWLVP